MVQITKETHILNDKKGTELAGAYSYYYRCAAQYAQVGKHTIYIKNTHI